MALSYDFTKVENVEELHESEDERGISHSLIWATMSVGIGDLSEENLEEFYIRLKWLERDGAFMTSKEGPLFFTLQMLRNRLGLHTNAGWETRSAWVKRQSKYMLDKVQRDVKKEMKEVVYV
jgi:hypothetical protein